MGYKFAGRAGDVGRAEVEALREPVECADFSEEVGVDADSREAHAGGLFGDEFSDR